jgi:hypothetical protein
MNIEINVELRDRLKKMYSDIYELIGSEEFNKEKEKCDELIWNEDIELSKEEEDYCLLFNLENVREFIRDMDM